jgi:leucyl aminopeptidase (aminopeptidase T)
MRPSTTTTNPIKATTDELEGELAIKIVSESLRLKKGDSVTVETWNNGLKLATKIVIEARRVGALPLMVFEDEDAYAEGVRIAPKDTLGKMGKHEYQLVASTDAYVFIPNPILSAYTKRLSSDEVDLATSYNSSWYDAAKKARLKGVRLSFGFTGREQAELLGRSSAEIVAHQLRASLVDFRTLGEMGKKIDSRLVREDSGMELVSGGSRLDLELEPGAGILEDGIVDEEDVSEGHNMAYMPPGTLTKKVKKGSINGRMELSPTMTWRGMVKDALLEFENGRLVRWTSKSSKKILDQLVNDQPQDQRNVAGLVVGLNPALEYGDAQDRFVSGSVALTGLEFTGIVRNGTLRTGKSVLVKNGKLVA